MTYRKINFYGRQGDRVSGLRPPLGANILLGGDSYYKLAFLSPLSGDIYCKLILRGLLCQHPDPVLFFRPAFFTPPHHFCTGNNPPLVPPRGGEDKSPGSLRRLNKSSLLSPNFLHGSFCFYRLVLPSHC